MNVLSLFSGYGGLDLGLKEVFKDAKTIMFCEIEEYPARILAKRFQEIPIWKDIYTLDGRMFSEEGVEIDIVTAGWPCQPFSHAGKRRGVHDSHGDLFWEVARTLGEIGEAQGRLPMFFGENVPGILSVDGGNTWIDILGTLTEMGYGDIRSGTFRAADVGAPHRRERVFILAHTNGSS